MKIAVHPITWFPGGKTISQYTERFMMEEEWTSRGWDVNSRSKEYRRALRVRTGQPGQISIFDDVSWRQTSNER